MNLRLGLGMGRWRGGGGGGGGPSLPQRVDEGLVAFIDPDVGLTDSGDLTEITQIEGVATFTPISEGAGLIRDDLGWGRRTHGAEPAGWMRAFQCAATSGMITNDPAVLSTFGATTTDFTVMMLAWPFSSNSNWHCWGIGNPSNNTAIYGSLSGSSTITLAGQSVGGSGTISVSNPTVFTRTRWPTLVAWRQAGTTHEIFANRFDTPLLSTTFTWDSNPSTRFGFSCRPDLSPDLGMSNAMMRWIGLYNRSLSDGELQQMGRYLGYRGDVPIGGWTLEEVTPGEWS